MPLGQFGNSRSAEDGREAGAVEGQVEEVAALVVAVEGGGVGGTVEPLADMELCRGLQAEVVGVGVTFKRSTIQPYNHTSSPLRSIDARQEPHNPTS